MSSTAFSRADLDRLLELYDSSSKDGEVRRPPWNWAALMRDERAALARMVDVYVDTYNHVHAIRDEDIIPPCWREHEALATQLPVLVWLYYAAHIDPKATPEIAANYYERWLPNFSKRLDRLLGASPGECRQGEHPPTWRRSADDVLAGYGNLIPDADRDAKAIDLLGALHYGFPHLNGDGQV